MVNTSEVRFYARWGSALCLARESGAAARRRCSAPGLRTLRQGAWAAAARPPLQRARTSDSAAGGLGRRPPAAAARPDFGLCGRGLRPCPAALCAPHSAAGCLCVVGFGRCAYDLRLSFLFVAVP
jgi:hypothetical protein